MLALRAADSLILIVVDLNKQQVHVCGRTFENVPVRIFCIVMTVSMYTQLNLLLNPLGTQQRRDQGNLNN